MNGSDTFRRGSRGRRRSLFCFKTFYFRVRQWSRLDGFSRSAFLGNCTAHVMLRCAEIFCVIFYNIQADFYITKRRIKQHFSSFRSLRLPFAESPWEFEVCPRACADFMETFLSLPLPPHILSKSFASQDNRRSLEAETFHVIKAFPRRGRFA